MFLHGDEVNIGDQVFDIRHGIGAVIGVNSRVTVRFRGAQESFDSSGMTATSDRPTLFWHDVLIVAPPKSGPAWERIRKKLSGVLNAARGE